jgi:hypothetical protein
MSQKTVTAPKRFVEIAGRSVKKFGKPSFIGYTPVGVDKKEWFAGVSGYRTRSCVPVVVAFLSDQGKIQLMKYPGWLRKHGPLKRFS